MLQNIVYMCYVWYVFNVSFVLASCPFFRITECIYEEHNEMLLLKKWKMKEEWREIVKWKIIIIIVKSGKGCMNWGNLQDF